MSASTLTYHDTATTKNTQYYYVVRATNVAGDGLGRIETAVREWMGLAAYRLTGRIDELLPGPARD